MFLFPRKKTMLLNNVFLLSSSLLALLSRTAKSFEMIISSRFLVGINAGTVDIFYLQMQFHKWTLYILPLRLLVSSWYYYKPSSLFLFRHQYECTAHVFWWECTEALTRGCVPVLSCLHFFWPGVGTGGQSEVCYIFDASLTTLMRAITISLCKEFFILFMRCTENT